MAEDSVRSEDGQPYPPQADCPACGSSDVQSLHPSLNPVCVDCGTVLSESVRPLPGQTPEDTGEEPELNWRDYTSVTNSTENQIAAAFDVLERIGNEGGLSADTRKRAAEIYAKAAIPNLTDGRSTELVIAASIALAAREVRDPIPSNRIADLASVRSGTLIRIIRLLNRELNLFIAPSPAEDYIDYLGEDLDLDLETEGNARNILARLSPESFNGKNPVGFAGAAIYLAANGNVTQREVADSAGITGETLRVRVLDLRDVVGKGFNE